MSLHWHRRDLRLADNPAAGAGDDPIVTHAERRKAAIELYEAARSG